MSVVVAYKFAPNPQNASVSADGAVDWSRAKEAISEYDPVAMTVARTMADAEGGRNGACKHAICRSIRGEDQAGIASGNQLRHGGRCCFGGDALSQIDADYLGGIREGISRGANRYDSHVASLARSLQNGGHLRISCNYKSVAHD